MNAQDSRTVSGCLGSLYGLEKLLSLEGHMRGEIFFGFYDVPFTHKNLVESMDEIQTCTSLTVHLVIRWMGPDSSRCRASPGPFIPGRASGLDNLPPRS